MLFGRACRRPERKLRHGNGANKQIAPRAVRVGGYLAGKAHALDDDRTIVGGIQFVGLQPLVSASESGDLMTEATHNAIAGGMCSGFCRDQQCSRKQNRSHTTSDGVLRPGLLAHDWFLLNCSNVTEAGRPAASAFQSIGWAPVTRNGSKTGFDNRPRCEQTLRRNR